MKIVDGVSYNKSKHNNKNRICNANKCNHTETWSMQRLSQWTQCLYLARDENPNENVSYSQYTWHVRGFFKLSSMRTFNNYPIISRHCQYFTSRETTLLKVIWLSVSSTLYLWNVELSHPIGRWDGLCWQNRKTKMPKKILKRIIKLKRKTVNASI